MADNLKAVIIEVTGGNVRNAHIYLREALGFFPEDAIGGPNKEAAGKPIALNLLGEKVETDIDGSKAIFRERGAIQRLFEREGVQEGDFILIERSEPRAYSVSKASKRMFRCL